MIFQSLTRSCEIGANSYRLDVEGVTLVLDAGMHPGQDGEAALPDLSYLPPGEADAILLTHAHLDHLGSLPIIMRQQERAPVFMTETTGALADAMLHNSVNVMGHKVHQGSLKSAFFDHREIDAQRKRWDYRRTNEPFTVPGHGHVTLEFFDSGHVAGSAGVLIEAGGKRIFYTGDVHFEDQTVSRAADFPDDLGIDIMIVETTRGASPRAENYTRDREIQNLADAMCGAIERGGSVLMPVFALGKTQEMLIVLHELKSRGILSDADVHIGGLATKVTQIFDRHRLRTRRHYSDMKILGDTDVVVSSKKRSNHFSYEPGNIYALSSGMMTEKTVSNRFAHHFLDNPRNAILFVGYSSPDSPAARILSGERDDLITLDANLAPIELKCDVQRFDFSGHAPRDDIADFVERMAPPTVLLVHGDVEATAWFDTTLSARLPDSTIITPKPGERIEL
ncbi:MAG: MBL fold metallo-hydrolase [Verrucomicrobia bacterium]|nr:MBL fold metallo-hydrolase [Verrucomicrobiota bacterium]